MAFLTTSSKLWVVRLALPISYTSGHLQTCWPLFLPDCLSCSEPAFLLASASVCIGALAANCYSLDPGGGTGALTCSSVGMGDCGDSCFNCFQVAVYTATGVSGGWVSSFALSMVLWYDLGVWRFLAPLFTVSPLSKHLGEVESFLWLIPAHRVTMETSLLCLILVWGFHQPFLAPVPKLIYWQ